MTLLRIGRQIGQHAGGDTAGVVEATFRQRVPRLPGRRLGELTVPVAKNLNAAHQVDQRTGQIAQRPPRHPADARHLHRRVRLPPPTGAV